MQVSVYSKCGVYGVFLDDKCYYIGCSKNLKKRASQFKDHLSSGYRAMAPYAIDFFRKHFSELYYKQLATCAESELYSVADKLYLQHLEHPIFSNLPSQKGGKKSISVEAIDEVNNTIIVFTSIAEACRELGTSNYHLKQNCSSGNSYKGFKLRLV